MKENSGLMQFEWDETKRISNWDKHKVDFRVACQIFNQPVLQAKDERQDYGEDRYRAIGEADGIVYILVYTLRGTTMRLISAWKAGYNDKERYHKSKSR